MSGFSFRLEQCDADEFSFQIEDDAGCTWRIPTMGTMDAVALFEAVEACIGEYVAEMRAARREHDARLSVDIVAAVVATGLLPDPPEVGFEGHGDFNSDDPMERYIAHQAAKGNL